MDVIQSRLSALQQTLATNVKSMRSRVGISQEQLALEAGIDRTYISKIERQVGNPSMLVLVKIAARLGVDVQDLLHNDRKTG